MADRRNWFLLSLAAAAVALCPAAAFAQGPVVVLPVRTCAQVAQMCRQNLYGPCNPYIAGVLDAIRYRDVMTLEHRQRICVPPTGDEAAFIATLGDEVSRAPPSNGPAPVCIEQIAVRLYPCAPPTPPAPPPPAPAPQK